MNGRRAAEGEIPPVAHGEAGTPVLFLMGPTAAGKTDLAVQLAARLPVEIISVDSAMVYKDMDIGTGKPGAALRREVPHRLIDIRDADQSYSAAEFRRDALREIADIDALGNIPLLVGGTGLYFRALRDGLSGLPAARPAVRARLAAEAEACGWGALHARLAAIDPAAAARIHPNDPQRIQRALEVFEITGRPMSVLVGEDRGARLARRVIPVILEPQSRTWLHRRIAERFRGMLRRGFVEEVRGLHARPHMHPSLPSMRSVGYRQVWEYLAGRADYETMAEGAVAATRQLARRQLTWLRAESAQRRFACCDGDVASRVLNFVNAALRS